MTKDQFVSDIFIGGSHPGNVVDWSRESECERKYANQGHEEEEHGFISGEEIQEPAKEYLHYAKLECEDKRNERSSLRSDWRGEK